MLKIILNLGIIFFWTRKMCSNLQRILPIKKKILDTCLVPKVWCLQELGQRWCCWRSWWGSQYLSPSSTLLCALQGGFFYSEFNLSFISLIVNFELSIARAKTDVVIFNQHFVLCLLVSGCISAEVVQSRRVAEVVWGHRRPPPKSLDSDKNFKPEHTLFCRNLRTFWRSLGIKSAFLGQNSASWARSALLHGLYCIFYWVKFENLRLRAKTTHLSRKL